MGPYETSLRQAAIERRQRLHFPRGRQENVECEIPSRLPRSQPPLLLPYTPSCVSSCLPSSSSPLLSALTSPSRPRLTIHAVKARVAAAFGISTKNKRIWLQRRSERMYSPRNVAMALAREMVPDASFTKIAQAFGERSHSTVLRACRGVESRCIVDDEFYSMIWLLRTTLRENFDSRRGKWHHRSY